MEKENQRYNLDPQQTGVSPEAALTHSNNSQLYSYSDYPASKDDGRREPIDGIAYDLTCTPTRWRSELSFSIATALYNHRKSDRGTTYEFERKVPVGIFKNLKIYLKELVGGMKYTH